jgi:glycosyltransferase involved in cell wall biosynthesis
VHVAAIDRAVRPRSRKPRLEVSRQTGSYALVFAEYVPPYMGSDRRLFDLISNVDGWRTEFAVVPPLRVLVSGKRIEDGLKLRCERHLGKAVEESFALGRPAHYLRLAPALRLLWASGLLPLAYLCSILSFLVQSIRLIHRCKPDLVVAGHPSYLCGLVAVLAARIAGVSVLLDYPDAWTPLAVETAQLRPSGLTARILLALEAFIAQRADRITSITAELAEYIRGTMRATAPIAIVGNGGDDRLFRPGTPAISRKRFKIPEDHAIAAYSGRLEAWSGTEALLETIKLVIARRPNTTFVIIGDGNHAQRLRECINAEGLDGNVVFAGYRPFAEMPALIGLADLAIIPFPRTPTTDVCAPIKLYEYLLMKKAVITTALRGIRESVSAKHVHFVEDTSAASLAEAVLTLLENAAYRADLAANGYQLAKARLTWDRIAAQFAIEMRKAQLLRVPRWARARDRRRTIAAVTTGSVLPAPIPVAQPKRAQA